MANYSWEVMKKGGDVAVRLGAAALVGLGCLLGKTIKDVVDNAKTNALIADKDKNINAYKNSFLGNVRYADQISALESEREQLKKKLK